MLGDWNADQLATFADLFHQTVERDFDRLYRSLNPGFTYANSAVIDVDDGQSL